MEVALPPLEPEIAAWFASRHGDAPLARSWLVASESATGARLERVVVAGAAPARYVLKRLTPRGDWIARATNDERMREAQIASGLAGSLPDSIAMAVRGVVRLADGAQALVMDDVSARLAPPGDERLSDAQLRVALCGLARLHSGFASFPARISGGLALCPTGAWLTLLAPATAQREAGAVPPDPVTPSILPGWQAFATLEPEASALVMPLLANPAPLVEALRALPATIVHGDAKAGNLAFETDGKTLLLLDWSLALRAPGALDLGWFLAVNSAKLPVARDAAIECYRAERERLGRLPASGARWQRELALALLAGTLRLGWAKALGASSADPVVRDRERAELAFWANAALDGVRVMRDGQVDAAP